METFKLEFLKQNESTGFKKYVSHNSMREALEVVRLNSEGKYFTNEYISYGVSSVKCLDTDKYIFDFIIKEEEGLFIVYEMTMDCYNKFEYMICKTLDEKDSEGLSNDPDVKKYIFDLLSGNQIEIGYRQTCGRSKIDNTFLKYKLFKRALHKLSSKGYLIKKEIIIHANAYATNNGGFWNSEKYKIITV